MSKTDDGYVDLLESIPGVGRQTAVQLMSMIVDPNRFPDGERFCAYFGMVPRVRDSGGKEHHGKLTKTGDKMMRSIMERVTPSHIRFCDSSVTGYFKAKEAEMGTKKAMITASGKMMTMIPAILKRGTPSGREATKNCRMMHVRGRIMEQRVRIGGYAASFFVNHVTCQNCGDSFRSGPEMSFCG